jgi:hypothetical protein
MKELKKEYKEGINERKNGGNKENQTQGKTAMHV